jgi:DNA invertase Pin-like site-specific DNA recombinase
MDGIDTKTAVGRMVFSMVGAISEFELNVISERTRAGWRRRDGAGGMRPSAETRAGPA